MKKRVETSIAAAEATLARRAYSRVFQLKRGLQTALWVGVALFSLLILAAPRFSPLLLRVFNDPFRSERSYRALFPVFLMVCSLLLVWLCVELLLVVGRLPAQVVSVQSAQGLSRGVGVLLALAVLEIVRVVFYPTLDAAAGAVVAALSAAALLTLSGWVRWQAYAQSRAHILQRGAQSHRRDA